MELLGMNRVENHVYQLDFSETVEDLKLTISVTFKEYWSLTSRNKDLINRFGEAVSYYIKGVPSPFPYEVKENLTTFPLHIPHPYGRYMFKACFDFFSKETNAAMHTSTADHPGYPLLMVTFDKSIISLDVVERVIHTIMEAIRNAETQSELIEADSQEENDLLDDIDENVVVEFDLDEELKSHMKPPVDSRILPMEGASNYD